MKKEYKLYVPTRMNDGEPADDVHVMVRKRLTDRFRGFTLTAVVGFWDGQSETTMVYSVITDIFDTEDMFGVLAQKVRTAMDQEAVLWTVQDIQAEFFAG